MRQANPSASFRELQVEGSRAIELIRQKANALGVDFLSLAESYKTSAGVLYHAGSD
jgi:hypothetical protein